MFGGRNKCSHSNTCKCFHLFMIQKHVFNQSQTRCTNIKNELASNMCGTLDGKFGLTFSET